MASTVALSGGTSLDEIMSSGTAMLKSSRGTMSMRKSVPTHLTLAMQFRNDERNTKHLIGCNSGDNVAFLREQDEATEKSPSKRLTWSVRRRLSSVINQERSVKSNTKSSQALDISAGTWTGFFETRRY